MIAKISQLQDASEGDKPGSSTEFEIIKSIFLNNCQCQNFLKDHTVPP
jgi:hypothetical protein